MASRVYSKKHCAQIKRQEIFFKRIKNVGYYFFNVRVVEDCNRLPGEMESPSFEIFQTQVEAVLGSLL